MDSFFKICNCGINISHGHVYLPGHKSRTVAICSLKAAREILDSLLAEKIISSEDKDELLLQIAKAGITEDGPSQEEIEIYEEQREDIKNSLAEFMKRIGLPAGQIIIVNSSSINFLE